MSRGIFLISENNNLVEMKEQPYESEDLLQRLLATHPALLAGDQIDREKPRKWLLISQELGLASEEEGSDRWSVDHLFVDQDAIPTVIEVKRSSDTRIRREVVGQMLEYAANGVVYWPVEKLRARYEATCAKTNCDPNEKLAEFLESTDGAENFWQNVKTNLQAGRIRLVFVGDEIPSELRRIVEFLNQQMDPAEVLAVEIKQFISGTIRTLVPSVIGRTEEAQQRKAIGPAAKKWDETSFFEKLVVGYAADEAVARGMLNWAKEKADRVWWGEGSVVGSFFPVFDIAGEGRSPFAVWTYGKVEILFQHYKAIRPFNEDSKRQEVLRRFNQIEGVSIPQSATTKRPSIPLSVFKEGDALKQFLEVMEWLIGEIKAASR